MAIHKEWENVPPTKEVLVTVLIKSPSLKKEHNIIYVVLMCDVAQVDAALVNDAVLFLLSNSMVKFYSKCLTFLHSVKGHQYPQWLVFDKKKTIV